MDYMDLAVPRKAVKFNHLLTHDLDLEFFKVKYEICYISAKYGSIAMKQRTNISIEL